MLGLTAAGMAVVGVLPAQQNPFQQLYQSPVQLGVNARGRGPIDAEAELTAMLSAQIVADIDRDIVMRAFGISGDMNPYMV